MELELASWLGPLKVAGRVVAPEAYLEDTTEVARASQMDRASGPLLGSRTAKTRGTRTVHWLGAQRERGSESEALGQGWAPLSEAASSGRGLELDWGRAWVQAKEVVTGQQKSTARA